LPLNSKLPDKELIFTLNSFYKAVEWVGFINTDGTELETRSYEVSVAQNLFGYPLFYKYQKSLGRIFTWSLDGESIGAIYAVGATNGQGYPLVIQRDGGIVFCKPDISIIAKDRILIISKNQIMAIEMFEDNNDQRLILYDMETCKLSKIIYEPNDEEYIAGFSYTSKGLLAIESYSPISNRIKIYDQSDIFVKEIYDAKTPSFSKDSLQIAYIDPSARICIASVQLTSKPICYNANAQRGISWSPDSNQLVYFNKSNYVILFDVLTGETKKIADGYWPDWRP
jgi:hypothetical protein